MKLTLKIWRQAGPTAEGKLVTYPVDGVSPDLSFLEMLDMLNEQLTLEGQIPIAFEHDCREGICGSCGFMIRGIAQGPVRFTAICQLFMRHFHEGDTILVEPFRARAFPIIKDLVVDRSALDKIIQAGGYISARTGSPPDANTVLIPKERTERALDAAACIGCGACVAACPNSSAMLFTAAKVAHLGLLPQGQPERRRRVLRMVRAMEQLGFGTCSNHGECEGVCPKGISIDFIARLYRDFITASLLAPEEPFREG